MEIIKGNENYRAFKNPVLTLGNFDGIHLGHQKIMKKLRAKALILGGESIVYTFVPHPMEILVPQKSPLMITSPMEKIQILEGLGIDVLICAKFTQEFSGQSSRDFIKNVLCDKIGVKYILVGHNYRFGKGGQGNIDYLIQLGHEFGFGVEIIEPVKELDVVVSSTAVRELIKGGEIKLAKKFLSREFSLQGRVIPGKHRGKALGFPTANLAVGNRVIPKPGIYTVRVFYGDSFYGGVANIGFNPTFNNKELSIEVHIFDFNEDIYDQELKIIFIDRLRDEKKFINPQELVLQIQQDITRAKESLSKQ